MAPMFVANMPRVVTAGELALQRSVNQFSKLGLIIHPATFVVTARVNGTPGTLDRLAAIAYDGLAGNLGDVVPGQTLWIGTTAGAYDVGMARIRKAPDGANFYIGEESGNAPGLAIADDQYLTVIDEMGIWARHAFLVNIPAGIIDVDYDIAYADQHTVRAPIPVMGPPVWLEFPPGSPAVSVSFDARDSWVPGGAGITFSWTAPGASATSGMATAQPTITYNATGTYRVACAATANGRTTTGYRYVYVKDPATLSTQFAVQQITGSMDSGGYSFDVVMYSGADLATIRDRAFVMLVARDWAGTPEARQTVGYVVGRENILAMGWIYGETIDWNPDYGQVSFQVQGTRQWIGRTQAFITGLENVTSDSAVTSWILYNGLTFQAAIWHLLLWRSTLATMLDCLVEPNTWNAQEFPAPAASLWDQLVAFANLSIMAKPVCDRYGRLFVVKDSQIETDRSPYPEVMTLTTQDWIPPAVIKRSPFSVISLLFLNGAALSGSTPTAIFNLSPGHAPLQDGSEDHVEGLIIPDQATGLHLAGLTLGWKNNEYPSLAFQLAGNNRWLDIAPPMYVRLVLATTDTPRQLALNIRMIPRVITYAYDPVAGTLLPRVEFEAETFEQNSAVGDPPSTVPTPVPTNTCPPGFHLDTDGVTCILDNPPPLGTLSPDLVYAFANGKLGRSRNFIAGGGSPTWADATGTTPGTGTGAGFVVDFADPKHKGWRLWGNLLERTTNLNDTVPAWSTKLLATTVAAAVGAATITFVKLSNSPTEPGVIYVGWAATGPIEVGVSVSKDSGATWAHAAVNSNGTIRRIKADPITAGKVWGILGHTDPFDHLTDILYSSTNYGTTWSVELDLWDPVQLTGTDCLDFDVDNLTGSTIVVDAGTSGIWYLHSGGGPYTQVVVAPEIDTGGFLCMGIDATNSNDVLYGAQTGRFWHSTDGGKTYSSVFTGTTPKSVTRWPFDGKKVFWFDANKIYYSSDLLTTQQDKTGNWATVFGAAPINPVVVVPIWVS
jgi:hypothetical protein